MKKTIAIFLMTCTVVGLYAQTDTASDDGNLKARKGSFATELNFNPFQGNLSLNNALNQIKGRFFIQEDWALRLGLAVNSIDSTYSQGTPYGTQNYFVTGDRKSTGVDINLGIEKHFFGTKRLSPYIGLDLSWGTKSSEQDFSNPNYSMHVKNAWVESTYQQVGGSIYTNTRILQNAFTRFGVFAVAGFDFYMAKNFLIGYEFNAGYISTDYKSPEVTYTGQEPSSNNSYDMSASSKTFSTSLMNGVRIGYVF